LKTIDYLLDPSMRAIFLPGVLTGVAIAIVCSCLSVLVVLKRLSFIGQGVSHAAFGGMGVAAVIDLAIVNMGIASGLPALGQLGVVLLFCLVAALAIAGLSDRGGESADTIIGIVLVASMTLGALLLHVSFQHRGTGGPSWESILFGSLMGLAWHDTLIAGVVSLGVVATLWAVRRPLLFWAFDEQAAPAFGVSDRAMKVTLMVLLCLAIVTSMKLAGVVLATAILVLPGATALRLSDRFNVVLTISVLVGVLGVLGGLVMSFEMDWPPGPGIVAMQTMIYAVARAFNVISGVRRRRMVSAA